MPRCARLRGLWGFGIRRMPFGGWRSRGWRIGDSRALLRVENYGLGIKNKKKICFFLFLLCQGEGFGGWWREERLLLDIKNKKKIVFFCFCVFVFFVYLLGFVFLFSLGFLCLLPFLCLKIFFGESCFFAVNGGFGVVSLWWICGGARAAFQMLFIRLFI